MIDIVTELGDIVTELGKKVTNLGIIVTELGDNSNWIGIGMGYAIG